MCFDILHTIAYAFFLIELCVECRGRLRCQCQFSSLAPRVQRKGSMVSSTPLCLLTIMLRYCILSVMTISLIAPCFTLMCLRINLKECILYYKKVIVFLFGWKSSRILRCCMTNKHGVIKLQLLGVCDGQCKSSIS